jgi:uncharacterized BrkB/YihY/UPF0761 family membrane protein
MNVSRIREGLERRKTWLDDHEDVPVIGVAFRLYRRDRECQGSVVGSAIAFRLFLFFAPLLVFTVGVAGFISGFVTGDEVDRVTGVSGGLAVQIRTAFNQPGATRWFAVLLGLLGMITAGRSLSKALWAASASAWGLPRGTRAPFRAIGVLLGLVCGVGLIMVLENRLREQAGIALASVSFIGVFLVYFGVILLTATRLPRATNDPIASLPGAALLALTVAAMQAISQFYLPPYIGRASELYGAIGTTIVTLGWFFILGRAISISMELDAVLYETFGSVSEYLATLPVVRRFVHR